MLNVQANIVLKMTRFDICY